GVDREPDDQQALREEAADALDEERGAPTPAGQSPGAERGFAVNGRALVSRDDQHRRFSSTGGVIAPTLKWSRYSRPHQAADPCWAPRRAWECDKHSYLSVLRVLCGNN